MPVAAAALVISLLGLALACTGDAQKTAQNLVPASATVAAVTPTVSPPPPQERVRLLTDVSTEFYPVQGSTTEEIFASMEANGPVDDDGEWVLGLAEAQWQYVWTNTSDTHCALTITIDIVVTLPRLAEPALLPPALLEKWQTFSTSVATHEQTHVDLYIEGVKDIETAVEAMLSSPVACSSLYAGIEDFLYVQERKIEWDHDKFHEAEESRLASLRAPLEAEIEIKEVRIAELATQIEAMEADLGSLERQAETLEGEMASLEAQIDSIEARYPGRVLPDPVYTQYNNLLSQYNGLVPRYNSLLEQYDSLIARYNLLVEEHDALVVATNEAIEQLNWLQ